jgi:general L-amino acid transport system substrate-binding protein
MHRRHLLVWLCGAVFWNSVCATAASDPADHGAPGPTATAIRAAGVLKCALNRDEADYSKINTHGNLAAFGADVCKAVAVAVLGRAGQVRVAALPDEARALLELKAGDADLVPGASPTLTNRALYSVSFGPTVYFDGQGFLVRQASGVRKIEDFAGKQICFIGGTEAEFNLTAALAARHIAFIPFPFEEQGEMEAALFTGHCAAISANLSQLANTLYGFRKDRDRYVIATETLSDDPLAPAYRADDPHWAAIVDWTIEALIEAEERGITASNVEALRQSGDPAIRRLLGSVPGSGHLLGLDDAWVVHVIAAVGNYGEIFERDLGPQSPLKLERGVNRPRSQGGLLMRQPMR